MNTEKTWNEYYGRQILVPGLGTEGQRRLQEAKVLIIGAGGLGCSAALHLALSGVGTIGIVDFDTVELSNLHRQPLYGMDSIGRPMAEAAVQSLKQLVPWLNATAHRNSFSVDVGLRLAPDYDLLLDCSDNPATRGDINQVAVLLKKPFLYSYIFGMSARLSLFDPAGGPCHRCLPEGDGDPKASGHPDGVLGVLAGIAGAMQAGEALKWIARIDRPAVGRLVRFEMASMSTSETVFAKNPDCPVCGPAAISPFTEDGVREISIDEFLDRRKGATVLDVREADEYQSLRLKDSVSIPLSDLPEHVASLTRETPILTICNAGIKSRAAARILRKHDFPNVFSLRARILVLWKSHPELFEN